MEHGELCRNGNSKYSKDNRRREVLCAVSGGIDSNCSGVAKQGNRG